MIQRARVVVGIGASAGGLDALEQLFRQVRPGGDIAYVIVQHLSPDHKSMMAELLGRYTELPIVTARDGAEVEPDRVYLMPPRSEMIISGATLHVSEKDKRGDLAFPIDVFLRSLAQDRGNSAVGVILSGTGSDGSRGVREIHDAGGLVICQTPQSAKFDGMPRAALDTSVVDLAVAPHQMAEAIRRYAAHVGRSTDEGDEAIGHARLIERILNALREESGIDFSRYKSQMVVRRIERRVLLRDDLDLAAYVDRIERDPEERSALYRDLLIGVTRFFRDRDVFELVGSKVMPDLVRSLDPGEELRIWVAGCGTGEEPYSLAILADEAFRALGREPSFKVFATDVHRPSLASAAAGLYTAASLQQVSHDRRERYFVDHGETFEVSRDLRQTLVFAPHNVIADAPFTKLHLIACRNLLIYLTPAAQRKALSMFLFGLQRDGILLLGKSENARAFDAEFEAVSERERIYRKRRDVKVRADVRRPFGGAGVTQAPPLLPASDRPSIGLVRAYDALLDAHMPPAFLVADDRTLLHSFGGASKFLKVSDGRPSRDVLDQVVKGLRGTLAGAIQRVRHASEPVALRGFHIPELDQPVALRVSRVFPDEPESPLLVTLGEPPVANDEEQVETVATEVASSRMEILERELQHSQESLQATIEELEASNEELQASNEELVASNEELQSTNEELQSVNEELYTVNAELQQKISELSEITRDMDHLLESMEVGILFLDGQLRIRRFTALAGELFSVRPQDIGRNVLDFRFSLACADLADDMQAILSGGHERIDREATAGGRPYLVRLRPYLIEGDVEGVVLTVIDVVALKEAEEKIREAVARRDEFIAMLSHELRNPLAAIVSAVDLARVGGELDGKVIDVIERQSRQMSRILEDLLDVSRIARSKLELRLGKVELDGPVRAAVESHRAAAKRAGISLHVEAADEPIVVDADDGRLQQVVSNLIANAIKYNSRGGNVWVTCTTEGGTGMIRVRDDGIGIDSSLHDNLFEPFVQSSRGAERSAGGLGMGLSLVRSLVELHGGKVWFESAGVAKGSEFVVEIPLADGVPERPSSSWADGDFVLLVEDDLDNRDMLAELLSREGYEVRCAADGSTAVQLLNQGCPKMALIDIGIPEPDGHEVARIARELHPDVPLVALTGFANERDAGASFDEHVIKPVRFEELLSVLDRFLGRPAD